jgi:pSer/pThr/pTyr-binding forkhead associated (FHA) protein
MWLTVHEPEGPDRRVEVDGGAFSVGRGTDCDLVLADVEASRRHALIERRTDGSFTLRDLASTNGTAVDGRRIAATVDLHDGEQITIGRTTLTVAGTDAQALILPAAARPTLPGKKTAPALARPAGASPEPVVDPEPGLAVTESSESEPGAPKLDVARPEARDRPSRRPSRRALVLSVAGGIAGLLVLVLILAQLVLPQIAGSQLSDSLKAHGTVQSVSVEAFPAVTLLWHHADKVTVRMGTYADSSTAGGLAGQPGSGAKRLADFLTRTSATDSLDARVGRLAVGRLTLESVVLTKHGAELSGSAYASYADLRAALPGYLTIRAFSAGGGELIFTGAAMLLGRSATVRMRLLASNGALVVQPDLGPFLPSGLSLTVFKDPRVFIESVAAAPATGGFDVFARARLTQG